MLTSEDLRPVPLFAPLAPDQLDALARYAADIHLAPGEYAVHEGDEAALFVVLSGRMEVTKIIDGIERKIGERGPCSLHGEVPVIYGTRFQSSGRAAGPARFMRLDMPAYFELAAATPEFAGSVRALAAERIGGLMGIAAAGHVVQATILGDPDEDESLALRRFLDRNHIVFDWIAPGAADRAARWKGASVGREDLPAILCVDGTTLRRPRIRELAHKMGLSTAPCHEDYDTVIIGGGPAGLAAAVYGASEGLRVAVIEREAPGGQAGTSSRIENYLGFPAGISGDELADRAHRQAIRLGAEILMTRHAVGIDPETHLISLDDNEQIRARTVIIATGVSWRRVATEGFDRFVGKGVYYGTARSDARIAQGQDVYLIGAGNSAGQASMFMANHARSVTLIVRGDSLEKSMSQYLVTQIRGKSNIHVALNSQVTAVHGETRLESVDILDRGSGTTRHEASGGVFVFIGADAETEWLPEAIRRDVRGYVLTGTDLPRDRNWPMDRDPYLLETGVPGIFACGDVRLSPVKRVAAAVGDGSMAIAFVHQALRAAR